jgi:hypothetical protein
MAVLRGCDWPKATVGRVLVRPSESSWGAFLRQTKAKRSEVYPAIEARSRDEDLRMLADKQLPDEADDLS